MQGEDGNIIDGFTPIVQVGKVQYDFIYSDLEPRYAGHKNTVETDQESSLIQAVYKYINVTADRYHPGGNRSEKKLLQSVWLTQWIF